MSQLTFDLPPFARFCRQAADRIWRASFEHPFVLRLADGSLSSERFRFYQMQDARYLEAFADAASLISTRCQKPDDKLWFIDAARLALVVESELHRGYGDKLGYDVAAVAALELTPNNRAYQDHMVATALRGSLVEAVAALTPCPWLYVDIGQELTARLGDIPDDHPYGDWLRMYSDPSLNAYMQSLLERLDRFAQEHDDEARHRAMEAFVTSARYEWLFWQQAWERQRWPGQEG